jgi:PAS domain S-box-containing protein
MSTVQLILGDDERERDERERRLTRMLEGCGTVSNVRCSEAKMPGADLWVVGVAALRGCPSRERTDSILEERRDRTTRAQPPPVLLVAPQSWLSQPDPALWRQADEVVCAPVRRPALEGRVQMLLKTAPSVQDHREETEAQSRRRKGLVETQRSREQLAAAERIASLGSWERDLMAETLRWSEETYRILGLSPEEPVTFEQFIELIHPEDRDRLLRQQERLLEEGTPIDIEYRIRRPDGKERTVQVWGEVDREEDGTPIRVLGAMLDVTERRRREQKIERLRKKYEGLLRGAPDAIFVADVETGRVVEANQAAASLLETSVEDLVGRHQSDLHPPEKEEQYRSLFEEYGEQVKTEAAPKQKSVGRLPDGSQIRVMTDSGARVPVEINTTAVELGGREVYVGVFRDARRRREAKRRRQILEQAVAQTKDAIFITDEDATILYANPATEEITGYDREELVGATPSLLQSGETPEDTYERLWSTIKQGKSFRDTVTDRRKDGSLVELDQTITPVKDETGEISRFVSTARDVTEQKEARRELQEREARLRGLANSIPGIVYQFYARPDGTYGHHFVSENAEEKLGISTELDGYYDRFVGCVPDSHRETFVESIDQAVETGEPWHCEFPFEKPSGERIWALGTATPEEREKELVYNGVILDITERKRQEKALKGRQEKIEALYETTRRLLEAESYGAVSDRIHEVLEDVFDYPLVNTGFVEGDLVVPQKTVTESTRQVPHPDPQPLEGQSMSAQALQAGKTVVVDDVQSLDNPVDNGDLQSAAAVPISNHGVVVVGQVESSTFDALELRLIEVLASYAALVLDRLAHEKELVEAKEKAEEAAHLKSVMLANMSHEIRTPLTSIIGFADAAGTEASELELPSSSSLEHYAGLIEKSGKRLLDTLEGVLTLSQLEAGHLEFSPEPVDLADQVRQTAEELRPKAREKEIDLHLRIGDRPVWTEADEGGVQIVMQNLLSNAFKYTEEGGTVRVRTRLADEAVALEVEDNGIGMEPGVVEELFEPFRQASEGFSREYEGIGVGLAVTQKAIQQMGGSIDVETEKGRGTRFIVRLPKSPKARS